MMYEAKDKLLTQYVLNLFKMKTASYKLRGTLIFDEPNWNGSNEITG